MHPTTAQNAAHRNDIVWAKSKGRRFLVNHESYTSEYLNLFTGQAIRKDWRMTGRDWVLFDTNNNITGRAHSLTWAKLAAAAKEV